MINPFAPRFPLLIPPDEGDAIEHLAFTLPVATGMCPISGNPHGGEITIMIETSDYPEVGAVYGYAQAAMAELVGGFGGDERRPAVRSMEGAISHIARELAAVFGCRVFVDAQLEISPPRRDERLTMHITAVA